MMVKRVTLLGITALLTGTLLFGCSTDLTQNSGSPVMESKLEADFNWQNGGYSNFDGSVSFAPPSSSGIESEAEFFSRMAGDWTAEDGTYLHFAEEDGAWYLIFAAWNAGGQMPFAKVSNLRSVGDGKWMATLDFSLPDTNGSYSEEYVFEEIDEETLAANRVGVEPVLYRRELPKTEDSEEPRGTDVAPVQ